MQKPVQIAVTLLSVALTYCPLRAADKYAGLREKMVTEEITREGITHRAVIQAMRQVPRHDFVPSRYHREAYLDKAIAIGHKQTISPPFIVAYMTESLDPQPEDRVLEIGTGSGYQAAILSRIVKEVYSIEIVTQLGRDARRTLAKLKYDNVHCLIGDGYKGWPEHAPFDKIIVTCSPESVPVPLVDQLREGGRMIVPLGERYQQVFYLFEKKGGRLVRQKLIPTLFVPMTGAAEDSREHQPDPASPELVNGGFEIDENRDDRVDNWHYQRQVERKPDSPRDGGYYLEFTNKEPGRPSQILQGLAIDGRKVAFVNISLDVNMEETQPGPKSFERPALYLHFYDSIRREVGSFRVGPWLRPQDWERDGRRFAVPVQAREAIIRVGLNGATGRMSIDNARLSFIRR
ncbi:MAG: protein-L-isoaspartate(D-aspartate) O-methyltransferase [Planctomycetaceae bacterium]